MHCPTAGDTGPGFDSRGWGSAVVRVYVDNEKKPSIKMTLLEMANVGVWAGGQTGDTGDGGPWGTDLFGHTAAGGGVYSTWRIPFGKSVKTTIESSLKNTTGVFWFIVRGIEAYPVQLGDLTLPATARLKQHRFDRRIEPFEIVTLANIPHGTAGAVLNVKFDGSGEGTSTNAELAYLEACMRAIFDRDRELMFLSSGGEDYFLSAFYFNEGQFKTSQSGVTYSNGSQISAYKTHDRDPLLFQDGFKLIWRNGENRSSVTGCGDMHHCPNQFCASPPKAAKSAVKEPPHYSSPGSAASYHTLVWVYEWPSSNFTEGGTHAAVTQSVIQQEAISFLGRLVAAELLAPKTVNSLMDRLAAGDTQLMAWVGGLASWANMTFAAHQLHKVI